MASVRLLLVMGSVACGGSPPTPASPSNRTEPTGPSPVLVTDAKMDCTSTTEDAAPGNHDRFSFESPDGSYGYKDRSGKVVIAPTFTAAYEFKAGGIAAVIDGNGRFAFIDPNGTTLARAYSFDNGPDYFQEGFARIVDDAGKIGFISDRGVVPDGLRPHFTKAESFCNGMAKVEQDGTSVFVDRTGAIVDPMHPPGDAPGAPK